MPQRTFRDHIIDAVVNKLTREQRERIARRYNLPPGRDPGAEYAAVVAQLHAEAHLPNEQPLLDQKAKQKAVKNMAQLQRLAHLNQEYPR